MNRISDSPRDRPDAGRRPRPGLAGGILSGRPGSTPRPSTRGGESIAIAGPIAIQPTMQRMQAPLDATYWLDYVGARLYATLPAAGKSYRDIHILGDFAARDLIADFGHQDRHPPAPLPDELDLAGRAGAGVVGPGGRRDDQPQGRRLPGVGEVGRDRTEGRADAAPGPPLRPARRRRPSDGRPARTDALGRRADRPGADAGREVPGPARRPLLAGEQARPPSKGPGSTRRPRRSARPGRRVGHQPAGRARPRRRLQTPPRLDAQLPDDDLVAGRDHAGGRPS